VTNYIDNLPAPPGSHWLNTSSNALIYEELRAGGLEIEKDLQSLLSGVELRYPINETITFRDIGKTTGNIWSFLTFSGYLKADDPTPDIRGRSAYRLSIPNRESSYAYETFIESLYQRPSGGLDTLLAWFTDRGSELELENLLQDLVLGLVSMYDIARLPEAVFHAFVLGLLANLRSVYEIRSNTESGYDRADILMIPKTTKYPIGYVMDFKSIDLKTDPNESAERALFQIQGMEYMAALHNAGVSPDQVRTLAIILQGKKVIVRG